MTNRSIAIFSLISLLIVPLSPHQVLAQTPNGTIKTSSTTYEDDRIKVVAQDCSWKLQDLICQAILTSKQGDRPIALNGNNIKLVDLEGNEYYPNSLRLANRNSENNSIKTELVENIPFKASFIFTKLPNSINKIALLQIALGGGIDAIAKFRNITVIDPNSPKTTKTTTAAKPANLSPDVSNDNSLICPDRTKILYRATSKHYSLYICGGKIPTHYVGLSKDGTEGITLRLRYYDRTRFSADNGDTNYTIAANKLIISKDSKVVYQEKIEVLQSLPGTTTAEAPTPKTKAKKTTPPANTPRIQKRTSTSEPTPKIKRRTANSE